MRTILTHIIILLIVLSITSCSKFTKSSKIIVTNVKFNYGDNTHSYYAITDIKSGFDITFEDTINKFNVGDEIFFKKK